MQTTRKLQICLLSILSFFLFSSLNVNAQLEEDVKTKTLSTVCVDSTLIDLNAQIPSIFAPVCGCDGLTYDNEYAAQAFGGLTSWSDGPCGCDLEIIGNVEQVSCFGKSDGSISIDIVGGHPPYTIYWETGASTNSDNTLNGLSAGVYTVTVIDATQCYTTATFEVTEPMALEAAFEFTSDVCDEEVSGCLTVSGGTMPYNLHVFTLVQFDGVIPVVDISPNNIPVVANASIAGDVTFESTPGSLTRCANNIPAGHYLVVIVDANGCYIARHIFIPQANPLTTDFEITNEDCEGTDGCLFIEGGTKPYRLYAFTCPDGTDPNVIDNAEPQIDAFGQVAVPNMQATTAIEFTDNLYWDNEICAEEIPAGTYYVLVLDANNCWSFEKIEIEPTIALEASFEITSDVCDEAVSGCLTVEGGTMPYNVHVFKFNQFDGTIPEVDVSPNNTPTVANATLTNDVDWTMPTANVYKRCANNIAAGHYLVVVVDANGCHNTLHVFIPQPNPLTTNFEITNEDCEGTDGCLIIEGGTMPYRLFVFTCPDPTTAADLTEPQIAPNGDVTVANMQATDAVDVANPGFWGNEICAEEIPAGTYYVLVLDANNCWSFEKIEIEPTIALEASFEITSDVCDEAVNGCLTVEGGTMPYNVHVFKFNQFDGTIPAVDVSPNNIPTVANATLTNDVDWTMPSANVYKRCANNIPAGHYLVVVVDANGCYNTLHVFIPEANPLKATFEVINEDCEGTDGCLFIEGGTMPYQVHIFTCSDPIAGDIPTPQIDAAGNATIDNMQATDVANIDDNGLYQNEICGENIPGGTYYVLVVDANLCWTYKVIEIAPSAGLEITGEVKNTSCGNPVGGAIDITVTGGNEPYFFQWSNGATTEDIDNLQPGTYTVEVYTTNDYCTATATFEVLGFDALELNFTFDQYGEYACIDPVGGVAPYTITWTNLQNGNTLPSTDEYCQENIPAGVYMVEVTDAEGCSASEIFFIKEKPCAAGQVFLEPSEISSGENTTFILEDWNGVSLQWQFRTIDTDWLIIPGATDEIYETPIFNVGCDKEIFVRAIVTCTDGTTMISDKAILIVLGNPNLTALSPKAVDSNLMNSDFMEMRGQDAQNELTQDVTATKIDAKVFPTTTTNDLNISFDFASEVTTTLRIVDLSGNLMWSKEMKEVTESTIEQLQVSHLANGRYFLHIENQGSVVVRSFFIEK